MRRYTLIVAGAIVIAVAALTVTGVTNAFGSGAVLRTNLGGSLSDGAAKDTFWDNNVIDVPGLTIAAVHCHGRVQYELQAGATGPVSDNACYAAMGSYQGDTSDWGTYLGLPGNHMVYRISQDYGPWRYCIGENLAAEAPLSPGPQELPCSGQGS